MTAILEGRVRASDERFAEYVRARGSALARTAFLLTGDVASAEDLLQSALAKLLVRWDRINAEGNVDGYVRRVMVTTRASAWRLRSAREQPAATLPETVTPDATSGVVDRLALLTALAQLPTRQRAAVVLRWYDGLSEAETAAAMGCSVGTVKSQTARGLAKLRVLLAEPAEEVAR